MTREGFYPWGSDTWGHLFKGHFLYKEFVKGNFFPLYTDLWYNGIQPFRYWAPIPYYILLLFELVTSGDSLKLITYLLPLHLLLVLCHGSGWGEIKDGFILELFLGILWFILPDNLRVTFCEGNIPRVVVTTLFPYLMYLVVRYLNKENKKDLSYIALLMFVITMNHAMMSAMTGITLFLYLVMYFITEKKCRQPMEILASAFFGIMLSAFWLLPALQGGIVSIDSSSVSVVMERLTYYITQSLNPFF